MEQKQEYLKVTPFNAKVASDLNKIWDSTSSFKADDGSCTIPITKFYNETKLNGSFSNHFKHEAFDFVFPAEFFNENTKNKFPKTVSCEFSEKAIMVCKALLMEDYDTFVKINETNDPEEM